jgi:hypothetical protein
MKIDWNEYTGRTLHITMQESYGLAFDPRSQQPIFEIVFKTGKLVKVFEDGLLLEQEREAEQGNGNAAKNILVKIFIPYASIKCVEIFDLF